MHPEIVRSEPGSCPICGMALEPKAITPRRTQSGARRHVAAVLGERGAHGAHARAGHGRVPAGRSVREAVAGGASRDWAQLVLATPVVLWGGWPFFVRGWQSVVNRSLNMFTLIALGVGVAYIYSVVATLFPGVFPQSFRAHGGHVGVYFEAAAVIVDARPARPGAGTAGPQPDRRGDSRAARAGAEDRAPARRRRQRGGRAARATCTSAIACGCGRARRCPSTASCSKERAPWTSRWSPASRFPSRRQPGDAADRRDDQRHRLARHARRARRRRHAAGADRRHGGAGAAQPRAHPEARRRRRGLLRSGRRACRDGDGRRVGARSDRNREWPTPWSTPSRC